MRRIFDGYTPALIAGLALLVLPMPLVSGAGYTALIRGSTIESDLGLTLVGFFVAVAATYGGALLGLALTTILAVDIVRCRGDESSWSPTYAFLLGGLCHAAGPFVSYAFLPSVPVLGYYLFRRRA